MRYYRQKLRPDRQVAIRRDTSAVSKVISHYKALGWTGTTGLKFSILPFMCNSDVFVTSYCYVQGAANPPPLVQKSHYFQNNYTSAHTE